MAGALEDGRGSRKKEGFGFGFGFSTVEKLGGWLNKWTEIADGSNGKSKS